MQDIHFHISYLLTQNECVVVPGLGEFVVSPADRKKASRWVWLSPPEKILRFNSEIKQNDGLLADSLAKERDCSVEEANLLIDQYVTQVFESFDNGLEVQIPFIGILCRNENEISFTPAKNLSCNALNYGLTGFSMPYVKNLQPKILIVPTKEVKKPIKIEINRNVIIYAISAAVALLVICFIPTRLNNGYTNYASTKYASFFQLPSQDNDNEEVNTTNTTIQTPVENIKSVEKTTQDTIVTTDKKNVPFFYIIVGSSPNQNAAKNAVTALHSKGFENSDIIHTDNKYRIYIDRFEDKEEAEKFLVQLRTDYPIYKTAWLLRNRD